MLRFIPAGWLFRVEKLEILNLFLIGALFPKASLADREPEHGHIEPLGAAGESAVAKLRGGACDSHGNP